ncbi:MAG: 16S rRNA (adenine(1518)-N(6)/adenine(1519)-N(6))-dimethyltransferase RsmA [Candidatus Pacebacteria bacterium]|nr:16S rRNA (adenine(1518)-N(6)/adenine(1519)-N(6))-dimethyltransferase RsmA [Candidatus Paceibacterota bacterium]
MANVKHFFHEKKAASGAENNAFLGGFSAKKSLGQNFLKDQNIVKKILQNAGINKGDAVLEIGPGLGALTFALAKQCRQLVAIEKDRILAEALKTEIKNSGLRNIEIVEADVREELKKGARGKVFRKLGTPYKIVANIPYYLTSFLIKEFLELKNQPAEITIMLQKEVAVRIASKPPQMNLLALSVQYYAEPKILFFVSKNSFWPKPKVDSAIIRITPKRRNGKEALLFFKLARAGFSSPRKQLINNLSKNLNLDKEKIKSLLLSAGIRPEQRPETLSVKDWEGLASVYSEAKGKRVK